MTTPGRESARVPGALPAATLAIWTSDIARTALFLASDDSTFVSGQAIAVDGALTAGREQRQGVGRIGESMAKQFGDLLKS